MLCKYKALSRVFEHLAPVEKKALQAELGHSTSCAPVVRLVTLVGCNMPKTCMCTFCTCLSQACLHHVPALSSRAAGMSAWVEIAG